MATQKPKWTVKVSKSPLDGAMIAWLYEDNWLVGLRGMEYVSGQWTPMRYWFLSMERRVEKATKELLAIGERIERQRSADIDEIDRLNEIASKVVEDGDER